MPTIAVLAFLPAPPVPTLLAFFPAFFAILSALLRVSLDLDFSAPPTVGSLTTSPAVSLTFVFLVETSAASDFRFVLLSLALDSGAATASLVWADSVLFSASLNRPSSELFHTGNNTELEVLIPTDRTLSQPSSIKATTEGTAASRLSSVWAEVDDGGVAMRMELAMGQHSLSASQRNE